MLSLNAGIDLASSDLVTQASEESETGGREGSKVGTEVGVR